MPSGAGTVSLPLGTEAAEEERQEEDRKQGSLMRNISTPKDLAAQKDAESAFISIAEKTEEVGHRASHSPVGMERMMREQEHGK